MNDGATVDEGQAVDGSGIVNNVVTLNDGVTVNGGADGDAPMYYTVNGQWTYTLIHQVTVRNDRNSAARNVVLSIPLTD
ncbi:MAG: hypothetical protein K6B40_03985, partial [Firmicutes bacterium]|nr:hypothetical protein [Bacillota bacterium]